MAHELAAALDDRARALGDRLAASPEPWLARQLGVLALAASPALRAEYTRRAGTAAAYREAAGITNPDQAVSLEPHRGNPELEAMRRAVFAALEIRDEADIIRGLDRGELEAHALQGQRVHAAAPADVSRQLRLTAQAEADAHQQAADARTQHDHTGTASATAVAAQLATECHSLEAANARYEQWSADTRATREAAGKATAEMQRRGHVQPDPLSASRPEPQTSPENEFAQRNRAPRLNELLARADQAARRIAAQQAERRASGEYAARMELEAQTQAEAGHEAEARDEAELEL